MNATNAHPVSTCYFIKDQPAPISDAKSLRLDRYSCGASSPRASSTIIAAIFDSRPLMVFASDLISLKLNGMLSQLTLEERLLVEAQALTDCLKPHRQIGLPPNTISPTMIAAEKNRFPTRFFARAIPNCHQLHHHLITNHIKPRVKID